MMESTIVRTDRLDSAEAGGSLGDQIARVMGEQPPDAVILFASSQYDYADLLRALHGACNPKLLVGCSSAGEFTSGLHGTNSAVAVALRSSQMRFAAGVGRGLQANRSAVAEQIVDSFHKDNEHRFQHHTAFVFADALAGYTDELVEQLTLLTAGGCQLAGGGAGDDAKFQRTHVFYGTEAFSDAAVALQIHSDKPIGIGVSHGWNPAGEPLRVTEVNGSQLVSLNSAPAVEVFQEHAEATGQAFDAANPLPFFLHNILGIETGAGYKLRVPLAVNADGSVSCAAAIPNGALVRIMRATESSAADAAANAATAALLQLNGHRPQVALFFDCVATRLRMGEKFGLELEAVAAVLDPASYAGCNTYGQIARAEGQFSGFHNCTAVVCVIPE